MKIYTKTGDFGVTRLYSGEQVNKSSLVIQALGSLDELAASLGVVIASLNTDIAFLSDIQTQLLTIGSMIATIDKPLVKVLTATEVATLELEIDKMHDSLPPLTQFLCLNSKSIPAAHAHVARTICRRAERAVVAHFEDCENEDNEVIRKYLNRLSDYLFTLARYIDHQSKTETIDNIPSNFLFMRMFLGYSFFIAGFVVLASLFPHKL